MYIKLCLQFYENVVHNLKMTFPLLNISTKKWKSEDLTGYILFDEYIYTDKETIFNELYIDKLFIDCNGLIYKALKKEELTQKWRKWLRFIPNIWKKEVLFQPTGDSWTIEELRNYLLKRVSELKANKHTYEWKAQLKRAKNHAELIHGQ